MLQEDWGAEALQTVVGQCHFTQVLEAAEVSGPGGTRGPASDAGVESRLP